ncbi:pyridoxamine 5'-phosphate oxidase family protein [Streptomyces sp. RPT161]|uniref:pyridoxamine 5'-phosphate oxidase family protein n=1 Tax=Streptomyces sp. RPT161 TaxID=3015993 RepID=UPI0022B8F4F2|nr:pyridoxamine 5'-phosphate oxidase family protein [Streptomyces sp. RPT161]
MTAEAAWTPIRTALAEAADYWVCTVRSDGRPHTVPVWGVWWRDGVVFSTVGSSVKSKNLRGNAKATVHLGSAQEVVIVDGTATEIIDPAELAEIGALFDMKYASGVANTYDLVTARQSGMTVCAVRAEVVRHWRSDDMFRSQRFTFDADGQPVLAESVGMPDLSSEVSDHGAEDTGDVRNVREKKEAMEAADDKVSPR